MGVSDRLPPFPAGAVITAAAGPQALATDETETTGAVGLAVGAMVAAVGGPGGTSAILAESLHLTLET